MDTSKLCRRAALLLIAVICIGGNSALAVDQYGGTVTLSPTSNGSTAAVSDVTFVGFTYFTFNGPEYVEEYAGMLTLTLVGLKPHTTYLTNVGDVKTDRKGTVTVTRPVSLGFIWWLDESGVWRDPTGQSFQVLVRDRTRKIVLSGNYFWQFYPSPPGAGAPPGVPYNPGP